MNTPIEPSGSSSSEPRKVLIPAAEISRYVANFTIGFGKLSVRNNVEYVESAGSGTLTKVGSIHGVLTAAHVLDAEHEQNALPDEGEVAIILSAESPSQFRRIKIDMKNAHKLIIPASKFSINGPDLAFLRISPDDAASIGAINSFYNLSRRVDDAPAPHSVDAIIGIIHERTKIIESDKGRATSFELLFCDGQSSAERDVDNYDLLDFTPSDATNCELPSNYEGVSGGGLWRAYFVMKDEEPAIVERRLVGVPWWQSPPSDGKRTLTCHGPKSIYGAMVAAIGEKWPEQSSS
jgi:hypothetical protein